MEGRKIRGMFSRVAELGDSIYMRKLLLLAGSFCSGLLCSRGLVFGRYAPFGVAAVAAVPGGGAMWAACAGAFFGYLLPSPVYVSVRYIAALAAAAAIRWSLSELKTLSSHPLFPAAVSFVPLLLTGVTMIFLTGPVRYTAALYVAESFLGAGVAYFFRRAFLLFSAMGERDKPLLAESGDVAAMAVTLGVLALSVSELSIGGVSLGRIFLALMVLSCARWGGVSGGAVAGVTAGAVQGLATAGLSHLSGAYGLGGLMAGVFAPMGKVFSAIAFILAHGVASLQAGGEEIFTGAIEVAVATVLYMVLPRSRRLAELFGLRKDKLSGTALRDNMVLRLRHSAEALTQVHNSVTEVSAKLSQLSAPNLQSVYDRAVTAVCADCPRRGICWGREKEKSLAGFTALTEVLREKGKAAPADLDKQFTDNCSKAGELLEAVNRGYSRYLAREAADLRASQVRQAAEQHFSTTAGILEEMAGEFSLYQHFDEEAAARVEQILRDNGATPLEVCCRIDRFGRMTVEAEIRRERRRRINRGVFTREISAACGRNFSQPCVSLLEDRCRIQMCQRPSYDFLRGFSQQSAGGNALCGDSCAVFYDGSGRLMALLSDGMGTGGRAAVDGAMCASMTESLLKAGVGFDSALHTVNAALLAKGGEESLATLDLCCVDLFSGQTELRKAGAACTILRRGDRAECVECASLPLGILPDVEFAVEKRELKPGDLILMVSDGVAATGTDWLCDMLLDWDEEENPNLLAERITEQAGKRRADGHEDDMSALVLCMV